LSLTELRRIRYLCFHCKKWYDPMDMHAEDLCKNCWERARHVLYMNTYKRTVGDRKQKKK